MASYSKTSPYYQTGTYGKFLDVMTHRVIKKDPQDVLYKIEYIYNYRPDLLAFDLYKDSGLWWVFAARNPDIIQDPIFDFTINTTIYIPSKQSLESTLGL